ncbi:MAG: LexA family transcriptional regulator [Ignavibacteria bacterium]|nr:LexA family transcriptional regulator [Ignavibacteria bacterium]
MSKEESRDVGSQIKKIRKEELNLSLTKLAERLNKEGLKIDHTVISRYETNKFPPSTEFIIYMKKVFGIEPDRISNESVIKEVLEVKDIDVEPYITKHHKPIYGNVYCGSAASQWPEGKIVKHIFTDIQDKSAFGLIAKGDSMVPYINPYDILICIDKPELIKNRTAVVVVLKSTDTLEANAKYILHKPEDKKILLYSNNTKYEPIEYRESEILKVYKVVQIIRNVK